MAKANAKWAAERYGYSRTALMLTGKAHRVLDVEPGFEKEIGYAKGNGDIHLAYEHEIFKGLTPEEKAMFRKGVFAHEVLHQLFSDFKGLEIYSARVRNAMAKKIFCTIANVLEDPAIEYWSTTVIGGNLLKALRFMIAHVYRQSPEIQTHEGGLTQFINALIHFGDMGLVKGYFTDETAKKLFLEAAPVFIKGIKEKNPTKRLDYAMKIFDISKPLWEKDAEEMEKLSEELSKMLSENQKTASSGSGRGSEGNPDLIDEEKEDKKSRRRKITFEKISKEEMEKMKKESSPSSGDSGDGDITVYYCDEDEDKKESDDPSGSGDSIPSPKKSDDGDESEDSEGSGNAGDDKSDKDSDEKSSDGNGNDDSKKDSDGSKSDSSDGNGDSSGKPNGDSNNSENSADKKNDRGINAEETSSSADNSSEKRADGSETDGYTADWSGSSKEADSDGEISQEEYTLTDEDIKFIRKEAEKVLQEYEASLIEESPDDTPVPDFPEIPQACPALRGKSCLNRRIKNDFDMSEEYNRTLEPLKNGIQSTVAQLKRIFENDQEEKEYRTSGRISVTRANSGRVTSRVFTRRKAPCEKSNLVACLAVDESGSMSGRRIEAARHCAISFAEVFAALNIPVYIVGFTADTSGYDVVHNHYITWDKNTLTDRTRLLNLSARSDNCDGYSIRYATKILQKKDAKNKLLIVISDGRPAAFDYSDGVADTKIAIKEAKKFASVLGVAIDNSDTETIRYMYEEDFLHVSNVADLFNQLSRKIKKMIRSWE